MLHIDILSSFSDELEKQAMNWKIPVALGAIGASTGAYLAGKGSISEHKQDVLMHDMDVMTDKVFHKRLKRRAMEIGGAAALGGIAGGSAPFVASYAGKRIKRAIMSSDLPAKASKETGRAAGKAGRHFAEGAIEGVRRHADALGDMAEEVGARAAKGARRTLNLKSLFFGKSASVKEKEGFTTEDAARGIGAGYGTYRLAKPSAIRLRNYLTDKSES